jgi:anti-sigma factor RsiW
MHQHIRESLEDYLKAENCLKESHLKDDEYSKASGLPAEFHAHLGECAECAEELQSLVSQSQLLRSLKNPQDVEPRAGFYARVIERIESRPASIWSVFLDRKFGFRLAVASAALLALLGTYLVTSEPSGPEFSSVPAVVLTDTPQGAQVSALENGPLQQQQRNAVLVDLASYHQ